MEIEKHKDEMHDKGERNQLKLEDLVFIFVDHVDDHKKLGEMEVLPYSYKYTALYSNPRPESRVREEDIRFLFIK
jgi:hypothetical protein